MNERQNILKQYARENSREALDQLIRTYRNLVYSAALRQVRDPHLAEDVTQAVFIVLSRKANTIREGVAIGGWLLAVTRRASVDAMRKRAIQHRHEHAAAKAEASTDQNSQSEWEQIAPVIDEAMSHLSNRDRDAVVLRYFEDQPFARVGELLCISEAAARKRVGRALERLRGVLSRRGATLGGAALGTMITAHAVHAAPVTGATTVASGGAINIAKGAIQMMAWAKAKIIASVIAASVVVCAGGAALFVLPQLHAQSWTNQPRSLQQQSPPGTNPSTLPDAQGRLVAARLEIANLETALDAFQVDTGRYPTTEQGLDSLLKAPPGVRSWRGPYVKSVPVDPWGQPYRYISPGIHNMVLDLWSIGPDGIDQTADDIGNWKR